ncbi:MAG: penicillin acylase family protein [Halobacteriaceae archaeon]
MVGEYTRRAIAAALLGTGVGAGFLSPANTYLEGFAPLSGDAWARARERPTGPVESPYGDAAVTYDEFGVPTITGDDERSVYYAVGYVHGVDRLFQMDLFRRRMRGTLSAVLGDRTLESDRFHRRIDFRRAAEVTWERVADTPAGPHVEAYAEGVNDARRQQPLPIEFGLVDYAPGEWTPVDTMLMEKQIAWGLTGSFRTLRQAARRAAFDDTVVSELFPDRFEHDAPIIQARHRSDDSPPRWRQRASQARDRAPVDPERVAALSRFEWPDGVGSNSWIVGGEHTASGDPLLANDPHLPLTAPPIWYEQRLDPGPYTVHGVTFPGVPFVVIGRNDAGAWGFTNAGADVIDFYEYDLVGEDQYRYRGATRAFETRTETIAVADGPDETIDVRESVHGPLLTREDHTVAMAWTGLTGTATTLAIYQYARSDGIEDILAATRHFDEPTQNLVYASGDGGTLYCLTGKIPIRRTDGEPVAGTRVFDGSRGEGEWRGFTPYGQSSWEGFIPFEEKPQVQDVDVLGTANQRITDTPRHYLAEAYSDPFRAIRLDDRLTALRDADDPITPADMRALQRDTYDERAARLVPTIQAAVAGTEDAAWTAVFDSWDYHMRADGVAPLRFALCWTAYREALYEQAFAAADLDASHWPADWVTATLPADAAWFDRIGRSRRAVLREAVATARTRERDRGYETYGDLNVADVDHPFDLEFLGYPERPIAGSATTLFNYHRTGPAGSSWRMVVPPNGTAHGILPGGNAGDYFDPHYRDQFGLWASGQYRSLTSAGGTLDLRFRGGPDE